MASRNELYSRLGLRPHIANSILDVAYKTEEEQIWREDLQSSPHGQHWHTSFHASSFPGDDKKACGRKAIYTLMNIPPTEPINRLARTTGDVGKAIEEQLVWRFYRSGVLLSAKPDDEHQLTFEDKENWLSGSVDAVIKTPSKKPRPLPVEVKGKDGEIIFEMQSKKRSYDKIHRNQILTYIGLAKEQQEYYWPELAPIVDGELLYVSRNRPSETHTYRFDYDAGFMQEGREKLRQWRDAYLDELLPERPRSWRWTEQPCKWCNWKKVCKLDYKEKVSKLPESNTIQHAKEVRKGEYDYEKTRRAVLDRWGG